MVDFIGIIDLDALSCAVGVSLLYLFLLLLLLGHCGGEVGGGALSLLKVDGRAAIVPCLIVERFVVAAGFLLLRGLAEEGIGGVALDWAFRSGVFIVVKGLGCERCLMGCFELERRFLSGLSANVFFVVKGGPFGV